MSSSLLIILLVIVWLFVLAPMVIRGRNPIRRTGDALAETRTLHSGAEGRLVPRKARTVADKTAPEPDSASLFGLPSGEGSVDAELLDIDEWALTIDQTLRREIAGRRGEAVRKAIAERQSRGEAAGSRVAGGGMSAVEITDELPVISEPLGEDRWGHAATRNAEDDRAVAASRSGAGVSERLADAADVEEGAEDAVHPGQPEQTEDGDSTYVVDGEVVDRGRRHGVSEAATAGDIDDEALHSHRDRRSRRENAELTDEDIDFAERRRGRGAYNPVADRAAAEIRAKRRQRTALGLSLVTLIAVAVALLTANAFWYVAGTSTVLLVAYLTYLRRQTKLEESLRRRRLERMRRARLGVESREDERLDVVPPRLRRPGAVVLEVDDEDPDFDNLGSHRRRGPIVEQEPAASEADAAEYYDDYAVQRKVG